ncbi:hypothetical protein WJX73_010731 [Symbiochloris irregularis]|uniref:Uncharacterized protein n=1 Tax=Symbiochloris irregularis TaxID=706552 RepID=A0AAW1NP94_9CHLO
MVETGSGVYHTGYNVVTGAPPASLWGGIMAGTSVCILAGYLWFCWFSRWRNCRGKMSQSAAGAFRLAAARNDIGLLELISRGPGFDVNCSVLGFSALHAAAVQGHGDAIRTNTQGYGSSKESEAGDATAGRRAVWKRGSS